METTEVEEIIVGSLHLSHLNNGNSNNKRNSKQKKKKNINYTLNDSRNWQHWGHAFWKHLKTSEIPNKNKIKKKYKKSFFKKMWWPSEKSSPYHRNLPIFHYYHLSIIQWLCRIRMLPSCVFDLVCGDQHYS